ncbi:MAG: pyridoxamine 5'-phosphate oxidase [Pseudobdellovibrionaceae bacterium]
MAASFDFKLDPFKHFELLFAEAAAKIPKDSNAMSLATVSAEGVPSARTVLFKGIVRNGFSFYTNYESPKARDLISTKKAALLFFWPSLDRQIRLEGAVEKLTREESEVYFETRPRLSQLGAWASHQSEKIKDHEELERRVQEFDQKFQNQKVPCPPYWGGFHLLPLKFEFWFARSGRLHERYVFERADLQSSWETSVRSP